MELTRNDFEALLERAEFVDILNDLDIDEEDHNGLFDVLDVDNSGTLDVDEIISGLRKLRGEPRKSDIVSVLLMVRHVNECLMKFKIDTRTSVNSAIALPRTVPPIAVE